MRPCIRLLVTATLLLFTACDQPDNTDPAVTIVVPANGAVLAPGNVTIKAVATDNKGVAKVEFYAGATKIGEDATGTADTFDISWTAAVGAYTLKAVASDDAGNTAEHSINVTVETGGGGTGPTYHSGRVDADEIWWPSGNPHILTGDVYPGTNVTITIKPGCIVKMGPGVELYCGYANTPGAIIANGTPDSVILFTSNATVPAPGDWKAVEVYDDAMPTTSFKHCIFEYGGESSSYGTVYVEGFGLKFSNNIVRKSGTHGVLLSTDGFFAECADNTITECAEFPLVINADYIRTIGTGNTITGNTKNAVQVKNGRVTRTGTWPNLGVPYLITSDVSIGDNSTNPVLTIAPGTTIQLQTDIEFYCGYTASGGLIADGTAGRITFTSSVPTPSRGNWYSVGFYEQTISTSKLVNCDILWGGGDGYGNVRIDDARPTITGCHIAHSSSWGIHLQGDPANLPDPAQLRADNTFEDNASGDVREP